MEGQRATWGATRRAAMRRAKTLNGNIIADWRNRKTNARRAALLHLRRRRGPFPSEKDPRRMSAPGASPKPCNGRVAPRQGLPKVVVGGRDSNPVVGDFIAWQTLYHRSRDPRGGLTGVPHASPFARQNLGRRQYFSMRHANHRCCMQRPKRFALSTRTCDTAMARLPVG